MAGTYLTSIGLISQLNDALKGPNLRGHDQPRIAVIGRSNVGKSSLINSLLHAKVAQISKIPGKTRLIHFYLWVEAKRIIADLPGYGFAKVSKDERNEWAKLIQAYLRADEGLDHLLLIVDSRHGPTELDLQALDFLKEFQIPMSLILSKSDLLKNQATRAARKKEVSLVLEKLGYHFVSDAYWVSIKSANEGMSRLTKSLRYRDNEKE